MTGNTGPTGPTGNTGPQGFQGGQGDPGLGFQQIEFGAPSLTFIQTNPLLAVGVSTPAFGIWNYGYPWSTGQYVKITDYSAGSTVQYIGKLVVTQVGASEYSYNLSEITAASGSSTNMLSRDWIMTIEAPPIGATGPTGGTGPTGAASTELGPTGYTGYTGPTGGGGGVNTNIQPVSFTGTGVPIDWALGPNAVFDGSEVSDNFRVNLTNLPTTESQLYDLRLIIAQSPTGYYANSMYVNGDTTTFGFLNDTTPTAQASKFEIQTFKIFYGGEGFISVFSELQSYYALP